jgi:hypothetical protein
MICLFGYFFLPRQRVLVHADYCEFCVPLQWLMFLDHSFHYCNLECLCEDGSQNQGVCSSSAAQLAFFGSHSLRLAILHGLVMMEKLDHPSARNSKPDPCTQHPRQHCMVLYSA